MTDIPAEEEIPQSQIILTKSTSTNPIAKKKNNKGNSTEKPTSEKSKSNSIPNPLKLNPTGIGKIAKRRSGRSGKWHQ